ncbi:MAG: hypothetical protein ACOC9Z_02185 [Chloroflexota bacterium]
MAEIFQCPTCSGRLEFDGGDHATVRCEYCGNTVIVPQSLRSHSRNASLFSEKQEAVEEIVRLINAGNRQQAARLYAKTFAVDQVQAREAVARLADGLSLSSKHVNVEAGSASIVRRIGCLIAGSVLLIVLGTTVIPLLAGGAAIWSVFRQEPVATGVAEVLEEGAQEAIAEEDTDFATLLDSFGSEGIAPGQFVDPRAIAVAPDGELFVADYSSGRVQRFDAEGAYLGLWQWEERAVQALAVGLEGDLYAVQGGDLVRFSRQSGEAQGTLTYESNSPVSFRGVAVAPNGDIVGLNHFHEYVRFDAQGAVMHVVDLEETVDVRGVDAVTVDGLGNVYVLGTYEDVLGKRQEGVFLFSSEGRYRSRFGSGGDEPGQFTSPSAVAVDGQGRIYVGDFPGIITFSSSGNYLGTTDTEGVIFGIAFGPEGDMLATGNANKVFRYALPAP